MRGDCFVYVFETLGGFFCKIGVSVDPHGRLATVQTGCPHQLFLAYAFAFPSREIAQEVEQAAHRALEAYRETGEWFAVPSDMCVEPIEKAAGRRLLA